MKSTYRGISILLATFVAGATCIGQQARAQAAASSDDVRALVQRGQKLNSEGKQDEALKLYKQALEESPNSYEAHLESGVALDLKGDYAAAREHLKKSTQTLQTAASGSLLTTQALLSTPASPRYM